MVMPPVRWGLLVGLALGIIIALLIYLGERGK